jgi:hypothetical protein
LFSSVVELLSQVALRASPSVRQAYRDDPARYGVTLAAVLLRGGGAGGQRVRGGAERVEAELSVPQVALDIAGAYQGRMIAVPPPEWGRFARRSLPEFAGCLRPLAQGLDWQRMRKSKPGPNKPPPKRPSASKQRRVSTARLLQERQIR